MQGEIDDESQAIPDSNCPFGATRFCPNTPAQDYTQLRLPEGAKVRLGKGGVGEIASSPPNPEKITKDINIDGIVNIQDLVLVASNFGETGQNAPELTQINAVAPVKYYPF